MPLGSRAAAVYGGVAIGRTAFYVSLADSRKAGPDLGKEG